MNIRKPFQKYVCPKRVKRHPEHVKIVNTIYDKYYPHKLQFMWSLNGSVGELVKQDPQFKGHFAPQVACAISYEMLQIMKQNTGK